MLADRVSRPIKMITSFPGKVTRPLKRVKRPTMRVKKTY